MPFSGPEGQGPFDDFEDCVSSMQDEEGISDAEGLCAVWMRQAKKLSDEYTAEELLTIKQELDLSSMEFMKALKLLEREDRIPPESAQENAQMALDARDEVGGDCGTPEGWERANQLANGEALSEDTIEQMAQFNRHRDNSEMSDDEGRADCGWQMWKAWGGDEGIDWAIRMSERMDEIDESVGE